MASLSLFARLEPLVVEANRATVHRSLSHTATQSSLTSTPHLGQAVAIDGGLALTWHAGGGVELRLCSLPLDGWALPLSPVLPCLPLPSPALPHKSCCSALSLTPPGGSLTFPPTPNRRRLRNVAALAAPPSAAAAARATAAVVVIVAAAAAAAAAAVGTATGAAALVEKQ